MSDYVILTDSSCDMPASMADELNIEVLPLTVRIEEKEYCNYLDERELKISEFYDKLRNKIDVTTSAVNINAYIDAMEPILKSGKNILCLSFSSGLSNTYNAGVLAANELREKYPDRVIYNVDTLCASLGQGLIVYLTAMQIKEKGLSIEEARDFAEETKMNICHMVIIDDLHHLKRGGRISGTTEVVGSLLNIKPIIHVDEEGHLIVRGKSRGRKGAINMVIEKMLETGIDLEKQTVFISHGDVLDEAKRAAEVIKEKTNVQKFVINNIGPVVGAHAGPGTIAIFFIGKER